MNVRELAIKVGFDLDEHSVDGVENAVGNVKEALTDAGEAGYRAGYNIARSAQIAQRNLYAVNNAATMLKRTLFRLAGFMGLSFSVTSAARTIIAWQEIEDKVSKTLDSEEKLASVSERLFKIANNTNRSYTDTANLFVALNSNAKTLGKTEQDVLNFVEEWNSILEANKADPGKRSMAEMTLRRAFNSGKFSEQTLSRAMLATPKIAEEIAAGLGTDTKGLQAMVHGAGLSMATVMDALHKRSEKLGKDMAKQPVRFDNAVTELKNSMGKLFMQFEKETGTIAKLSKAIKRVADIITRLDARKLSAAMRTALMYATAFFAVSKWNAIVTGIMSVVRALQALKVAFAAATTAKAALLAVKASLATLLGGAELAAIAAVITIVILAIEDLYYWITGGESVIGDWLGSWDDFTKKIQEKWEIATTAIKELFDAFIVAPFKGFLKLLIEVVEFIEDNFTSKIRNSIKAVIKFFTDLYDNVCKCIDKVKEFFDGVGKKFEGVVNFFGKPSDYSKTGGSGGNVISNSGNRQTTITIQGNADEKTIDKMTVSLNNVYGGDLGARMNLEVPNFEVGMQTA